MVKTNRNVRNIAIIAHVDHGKTTLVDQLLRQSGTFRENQMVNERIMDSNDLEKERGITILAKNCAVKYNDIDINIVDTPGHADFGGEVERVLSMVDSVLLLVDAVEGPMPQTRFVTKKALALGLKPIVVVNKIDRDKARPEWVVNATFELFDKLHATEDQLDFPVLYASALAGYASTDPVVRSGSMQPLFEAIIQHVPVKELDSDGPLQMQISSLDFSSYVGKIGIGRINRGRVYPSQDVVVMNGPDSSPIRARISQVLHFKGLERVVVDQAVAGDIVLIHGIESIDIGSTICDVETPEALPMLSVDEPTMTMNFMVNTSPFAGKEGKFVTSRQLRERLERELKSNVAFRFALTNDETVFEVSGRGELHLTILIENMRREGFEFAVSRPNVVYKILDGKKHEPYEWLTVEMDESCQGAVMEELGRRRAEFQDMQIDGKGRVKLEYRISVKNLIGFQSEYMTLSHGTGLMSYISDGYHPVNEEKNHFVSRRNGVLVSQENGVAIAYALWKLQERGSLFINHNDPIYEGMIIGIHTRENDLVVNPARKKQLTNIRAAGNDDAIRLIPPVQLSLEYAIEFINDDELVEITPKSIRLRKRFLKEFERKRSFRQSV